MHVQFRKPTNDCIHRFVTSQKGLGFTYARLDETTSAAAHGYVVDHTRTKLGHGRLVFERAMAAIQTWDQFRIEWLEIWPPSGGIEVGEVAVVAVRLFGLWSLNATRIVFKIDDTGPVTRFGFAYGTLPGHVASGEERFLVEWNHADDSVWYDILAFSRYKNILVRLGYPLARHLQKRFARDSTAAMALAVKAE